jgi:hypothetical protein
VIILGTNYGLSFCTGQDQEVSKSLTYAFQNSVIFYNSGKSAFAGHACFQHRIYLVGDDAPYLTLALSIRS